MKNIVNTVPPPAHRRIAKTAGDYSPPLPTTTTGLYCPLITMHRAITACSLFLPLGTLVVCLSGCVERELQIDSAPQGALVFVNGQEFGRTPTSRDFTWYGTYDLVLRKDGYETLKTQAVVNAPWWQWVPFDFVAEVMPMRLRDREKLHFEMKPESSNTLDPEKMVKRGERMRDQLEFGAKSPKQLPEPATKPSKKPSTKSTSAPTRPTTRP